MTLRAVHPGMYSQPVDGEGLPEPSAGWLRAEREARRHEGPGQTELVQSGGKTGGNIAKTEKNAFRQP